MVSWEYLVKMLLNSIILYNNLIIFTNPEINSLSSNSETLSLYSSPFWLKDRKTRKSKGENYKQEKDEMKIQFSFSFWLTCRLELKCCARIYRGLNDRWIFALFSAEILNPVSNTEPQERWSAVTPVKRK